MLWDALCIYTLNYLLGRSAKKFCDVSSYLFKLVSPGARQQVEQQLRSALKTPHEEEDITYIPCINERYPSLLRQHAASLFCTAGFPPCEEHPTQGVSIDIPPGILDDAPLAVMLGVVVWFAICLRRPSFDGSDDQHDENWHVSFFYVLGALLETFTEYTFPKLPAQGFAFCIELSLDCPEDFGDDEPKRILRIFAAVAIFLRNKNVLLGGCRRCQILCTRFFSDTTRSTSINESSVNTNASGIPS